MLVNTNRMTKNTANAMNYFITGVIFENKMQSGIIKTNTTIISLYLETQEKWVRTHRKRPS